MLHILYFKKFGYFKYNQIWFFQVPRDNCHYEMQRNVSSKANQLITLSSVEAKEVNMNYLVKSLMVPRMVLGDNLSTLGRKISIQFN